MKKSNSKKKALLTRKRILAAAFSLVLAVFIFAGASYSFLKMNTGAVVNSFSKGGIGVDIVESVRNSVKEEIKVQNSGESPAYVRVRLVSYWKDSSGSIAAKSSPKIEFSLNTTDWKQEGDYYYYKKPLAGGAKTQNLIAEGSKIQMEQDEAGNRQVIEVLAEVVQATPAEAVKDAWGIADASEFFK